MPAEAESLLHGMLRPEVVNRTINTLFNTGSKAEVGVETEVEAEGEAEGEVEAAVVSGLDTTFSRANTSVYLWDWVSGNPVDSQITVPLGNGLLLHVSDNLFDGGQSKAPYFLLQADATTFLLERGDFLGYYICCGRPLYAINTQQPVNNFQPRVTTSFPLLNLPELFNVAFQPEAAAVEETKTEEMNTAGKAVGDPVRLADIFSVYTSQVMPAPAVASIPLTDYVMLCHVFAACVQEKMVIVTPRNFASALNAVYVAAHFEHTMEKMEPSKVPVFSSHHPITNVFKPRMRFEQHTKQKFSLVDDEGNVVVYGKLPGLDYSALAKTANIFGEKPRPTGSPAKTSVVLF